MSKIFKDLKLGLDDDLEEKLALLLPNFSQYRILKKSIDARKRSQTHFVYSVEVFAQNEVPQKEDFELKKCTTPPKDPINIVGAGPAGLFAAIRLLERGIPCRLFERGSPTEERLKHITRFWRYGELNPHNNVCFGEGGAGLYSDGKLITRIKSPYIAYVMHRLVMFGAPEEIKYLANPHVGSDRIRRIIPKLREYIRSMGGEIFFDHPVEDLIVKGKKIEGVVSKGKKYFSEATLLATGHSARDVFEMLHKHQVQMENKDFAMGLRIEHSQEQINKIQYRKDYKHEKLSAANYKLAYHNPESDLGIYSFCMCPGGYVLSSGTESDGLVCNGMSNYNRNSKFANSAIVVTFKNPASNKLFYGLKVQDEIEKKAYLAVQKAGGSKELPAQRVEDFIANQKSDFLPKGSSPSGCVSTNLNEVLPEFISEELKKGLQVFNKKMPGFINPEAVLYGVESRTSSPLRVPRDKDSLQSISHSGLYPCGEGAGYAGGITSAACDGINIAEVIFKQL